MRTRLVGVGVAVLVVAAVVSAVVVSSGGGDPAEPVVVVEEAPEVVAAEEEEVEAADAEGDEGTVAARCTHPDDPTCIRAVYRGAPGDYAQVSDIPAWALIQSDRHGRYHVGRGWLVTVVTAASPPDGHSQFSLQRRPTEGPAPALSEQLVSPEAATYSLTVTPDEDGPTLFTYDLTAAKPPARPGAEPELGDVVATTQFLVPALRYNRLAVGGEAATTGSYVFLNTAGRAPRALDQFGQVPWGTGELRIHPTDAGGTSRAAFYDAVRVGDSFDYRTHGLDCGFRFEVTSVGDTVIPRTFGIQRVGQFGQRCSQFIGSPGRPKDVYFVWGVRPAIEGSGRALVLPYREPAGPGTYRLFPDSSCIFDIPAAMRVIFEGIVISEMPAGAPPDAPRGAALLADADTDSRLGIDSEWCRAIGRGTASPRVNPLFEQIAGSMRHEDATSTDLPGGRCGEPSDPACIWVVHRGTPEDHPWIWEMPASAIIVPDARGRYQVARGETVTVRNLAYRPAGYSRFSPQTRPEGKVSPTSSPRPVPRDVRSYTFTVTADEDAPNLFTYDLTAAREGEPPGLGDVLVTTEFLVPTLRYDRLDGAGAAAIPGSYAFLRRPGDTVSAIRDFGYSAADGVELRIHPTDASGASRAVFYDTVRVGDVFDYRANDVDCGLRFTVTSVATTTIPRTFGVRYVADYGGRCDAFIGAPGVSRDGYFVWGVRPGIQRQRSEFALPRGEPTLLYGEPVGQGTYRFEAGLPCIVEVPAGDEIVYGGSYDLRPDAADPDAPTGGMLLFDAEMVSTLHIDTPTCREIARSTTSSVADALFDQIMASIRRSE